MKKIFKLVAILLLVALFIGTIFFLWQQTQPKVVTYELIDPVRETLTEKSVATGKIEPRDEVLIKPQISGIISEIYVKAGQMVKQGDVIAQVEVIPEMGSLSSAQSRVRQAEIDLAQVEKEYNRIKSLYDKGIVTLEEFEKSESTLKGSKETLTSAKESLEIVEKGMTSRSSAVNNTQVRATVTGMVLDVPVKVGNSVILSNTFNDGTTVASIADLSDMLFVGDVHESEVGKLSEGMKAEITIGALQGVTLDAALEYISPKSSIVDNVIAFQIKAAIEIPDSIEIRSGYSSNASFIISEIVDALSIPESSVIFENSKAYVEVLSSGEGVSPQTFVKKEIETGFSNGVSIEVTKGLDGSEKLKGGIKSVE